MKKTILGLVASLLVLVMAFSLLTGCKLNDDADAAKTESGDTAAADADNDAIAISIGDGKYTVTRGEVQQTYENMIAQYSAFGMSAPTAEADIESMQDSVASMLAADKMLQYEAELMGITLDQEAQDGVDATVEEEMSRITADFKAQAESEGAEDADARAVEIFNEQLQLAGLDMDMEGYREQVRDIVTQEALSAALEKKIKSAVTATSEEAKTYYDDLLASQKETYAEHPEYYLDDQESYEKFGGDPVLVTPEGYIRVRTITIVPEGTLGEDYTTLTTEMGALEAEYGKLTLTNATANAARIAEIKTEYAAKKTEADKLYADYIKDASDKADEAYQALVDGKAFDETLKTYSTDELYTTYPSFVNTGLLMQKGVASSTWPQALVDAADTLAVGAYSKVIFVEDKNAYYIIELVGDEPAGEAPYGDVEEEMTRLAADSAAETLWQEKQEEWLADPAVVTYHEEVYRDVGKAVG